jgi:hypothetical protein
MKTIITALSFVFIATFAQAQDWLGGGQDRAQPLGGMNNSVDSYGRSWDGGRSGGNDRPSYGERERSDTYGGNGNAFDTDDSRRWGQKDCGGHACSISQ